MASGTVWLTFMQVVNYAIAFVFYLALARTLSRSEVGSFSLLLSVIAVYNTFTMLALNNAAIKFISEHVVRGETALASAASRKIFETTLIISVSALIISLLLAPFLASQMGCDPSNIVIILLVAFILNITSYYGGLMFGLSMFKAVALQNMVYYATSRFPAVALAYVGLRMPGLMMGFLMGAVACLIFSVIIVKGRLEKGYGNYPLRKILSFSKPIYANNIVGLTQGWMDVIILSFVAGLTQTGAYYMAVASAGFLSILWMPLASTLFPTFSSLYGAKGKETLENALATSLRITTFVVLPLGLALAVVSPTALALAYGEGYRQAAIPFTLFASLAIILAYTALYTTSLQALGETKPIFIAGAVSTAIYVVTLPLLSGQFGPLGAALSRTLLGLISFIILHLAVSRRIKLCLDVNTISKSLALSGILMIPLMLIESFLNTSLYLVGAIETVALVTMWIIGTKLFKPLNHNDADVIRAALPAKLMFMIKFIV